MLKLKQFGLLFFLAGIIVLLIVAFFFQDSNTIQAYPPPAGLAYLPPSTPTPNQSSEVDTSGLTDQYYLPGMYRHWVASNKKGLAYTYDEDDDYIQDSIDIHIHWYHNWSTVPEDHISKAISAEFVPFIWCKYGDEVPLPTNYNGYVLFFNEPDETGHDCANHLQTPIAAAQEYVDIKEVLPYAKLIGPHLTSTDQAAIDWINEWRQAVYDLTCPTPPHPNITCGYPDVVGYGFHHYSDDTTAIAALTNLCNAMEDWGELAKEIWITEFGWGNLWPINNPTLSTQEVIQIVDVWENGVTTAGGSHCAVNRYAYWDNRTQKIVPPGEDTPTPESWDPGWYTDLYCHQTYIFSHTGEGYKVSGNIGTPVAPGQSSCPLP